MNTLRDLLILNFLLQLFDGFISLQALSIGAREVNPLVAAAMFNWGVIWGLIYSKSFACVLLLTIFALRHNHQLLARQALTVTASVYACVGLFCLWGVLR